MEVLLLSLLVTFIHLHLHKGSAEEVFVQTGESIMLNITGHEDKKDLRIITWNFNHQVILTYVHRINHIDFSKAYRNNPASVLLTTLGKKDSGIYTTLKNAEHEYIYTFDEDKHLVVDKVEFDTNTFSLLLKNPQKTDSGRYTAEREDEGQDKKTTEWIVSVLEPAAAPTLTVVYSSSSSDSCNVTLNCTGLNVFLISSCNTTFCSQEGGDRFLSISVNHTTFSCNHSNPVSWKQATVELTSVCQSYRKKPMEQKGDTPWWTIVGVIVGLLLVILIVLAVIFRRMKGGTQTDHNPQSKDHSAQEGSQEMDPVSQPGAVESPGSTDNPYDAPCNTATAQTVYDTVNLPLPHSPSTQDSPLLPEASADVSAETFYAVVDKKKKVRTCLKQPR